MADELITENSPSEGELTAQSHKHAVEITKDMLQKLLKDPLLSDIPLDITSKEIQAIIDLEKGKAFKIQLVRDSENGTESFPFIINQKTTLAQLKTDIQKSIGRRIIREGGPSCLSWKYFWKTYWLVHQNDKLTDNNKKLKEYGIKDKAELHFLKRLRRT